MTSYTILILTLWQQFREEPHTGVMTRCPQTFDHKVWLLRYWRSNFSYNFFFLYFNDPSKPCSCTIFWSEFTYLSEIPNNVKAVSVSYSPKYGLLNMSRNAVSTLKCQSEALFRSSQKVQNYKSLTKLTTFCLSFLMYFPFLWSFCSDSYTQKMHCVSENPQKSVWFN